MANLSKSEQDEARAIGQKILFLTAGHRVPVGLQAQLDALATGIAGIFPTLEDANAFIDQATLDLKANVERWHGTIEHMGPALTKKHGDIANG